MKPSRIVLSALALAASSAFAGTADVRFIDPDNFADLATNYVERGDTMKALADHIGHLARQLPPDQVLRVDVLDVDLAGTAFETRRGRVRTVRNRADLPMIQLRYTLESNGSPVKTGEERLTDLDYANHYLHTRQESTPLFYEKRLLNEWFNRTFEPQKQAYAR